MDSNVYSTQPPQPPDTPDGLPGLPVLPAGSDALVWLAAADQALAVEDLDQLTDAALDEQLLALQRWADRLHGHCLRRLAAVDARGAAGADHGIRAASTAGWLRNRLRMSAAAAHEAVQTARALFRGPLVETAQALTSGQISPAHARALAQGTRQVPDRWSGPPNQSWLRRPAAWIHPGSARPSGICWTSPTLKAPMPPASAARSGGACGCHRPWTAWSRWMGCWSPRPALRSWRRWSPWPAQALLTISARVANGPPTRWLSCAAAP